MNLQTNIISKLLFGLIVLGSIGVIFYKFTAIPAHLAFDEIEFAHLALSLDNQPYTPYSELATGHATMYFYIILASFKTFGINSFGLRFPSAVFGVLNIILIAVLFSKFYHKSDTSHEDKQNTPQVFPLISSSVAIPILITCIAMTLRWHFNFARFSFEGTFLLFLELMSLFFLFSFLKTKNKVILVMSGIMAGLAYNSYTPGRLFFIAPLSLLLLQQPFNKKYLKDIAIHITTFIIPFIITILPLTLYLTQHPDLRIQQLSYFHNPTLDIYEKISYIFQNIGKTFAMFFTEGDLNGRHNYPAKPIINPLLAGMFVAGFLLTIMQWKYKLHQFFLIYFVISIIPTLLTYPHENPNNLRTFSLIPCILFFISIFFNKIVETSWPKRKIYVIIPLIVLILVSSIYELRTYFVYQTQIFGDAFIMKGPLNELVEQHNSRLSNN